MSNRIKLLMEMATRTSKEDKDRLEWLNIPKYETTKGTSHEEQEKAINGWGDLFPDCQSEASYSSLDEPYYDSDKDPEFIPSEESNQESIHTDESQGTQKLTETKGTDTNNCTIQETAATSPINNTPINKSDKTKPDKQTRDKHMCVYCETEVNNFARHVVRWHHSEIEVQNLITKPKGSKERKDLINFIRNKGNFLKNNEETCDKPMRRTPTSAKYLPCTFCYGYFRSNNLYKHVKRCPQNDKKNKINQVTSQNFLLKNLKIDEQLKTQVFPRMRADHVSLVAKKDFIITKFGARYLKTHREKHFVNVVSRKMRELARLLIECRKRNANIQSLFDLLKPEHYELITEATKEVAKFSDQSECFGSPTYAMNIATSLKDCCNITITYVLQRKHIYNTVSAATSESDLRTLLQLIQGNWQYDVSTLAANDLNKKKWNKITIVPLAADLKILKLHLEKQCEEESEKLKNETENKHAYKSLLEVVFCRVLLLNRKRPGELQRMLIDTYVNAEERHSYDEFKDTVSHTERVLMAKFKRVVIRGKRGRGVPVLFSSDIQCYIELLLKARGRFFNNISNPYLFGSPGLTSPICGYKVLEKVVKKSGLKCPQAVTSTKLRKHLATITQLFNMTENDIEQLATFMGHTDRIHRGSYRLPDDVYQTAKLCKILLAMENGSAGQWKGKTLDEIEIDTEEDLLVNLTNEENDILPTDAHPDVTNTNEEANVTNVRSIDDAAAGNSRQHTQIKKRILEPWTTQQKELTKRFFAKHIKHRKPPKRLECEALRDQNPSLFNNKNWLKIKVFVQNTYKNL